MKTQKRHRRILKGNERLSYAEWCERCRDRTDPLNNGLLFSLPMFEGVGTATVMDVARPHHPVTQTHAPVWTRMASGLWVLALGGTEYLECAAASCTDLNFTSGDFSFAMWINPTDFAAFRYLMVRGKAATAGWYAYISTNAQVGVKTVQGAAAQETACYSFTAATWALLAMSRVGSSVRCYQNGVDRTVVAGSHVDPTTYSGNLVIGASATYASGFVGSIGLPRIWGRALSPSEHKEIYRRERGMFGV